MRILADASFPRLIEEPNAGAVLVDRYVGELLSDSDLITFAAENGYAALAMLGRGIEADPRLSKLAQEIGVTLITTTTDSPTEAAYQLLSRLADVVDQIPQVRPIVVGKNGVRVESE